MDVREEPEYEHCCLKDCIWIPVREIPGRLDELNSQATTVVYCHHGIRSMMVGKFLEEQGFNDIKNLKGGIDAWSIEVDPEVPRY